MDAVIILFGIMLLISAGYESFRKYKEGRRLFTAPISKVRARFLKEVFGLTGAECRMLHFDGYKFHLRRRYPYSEFRSISLVNAETVRVMNPRVPHYTTWAHTRIDGLPDRRYSYNPPLYYSCRFKVRFRGKKKRTLVGYTSSCFGIEKSIGKVNTFLKVAGAIKLEAKFLEYEKAFRQALNAYRRLKRLEEKRKKMRVVLSSAQRLKNNGIFEEKLLDKYKVVSLELQRLDSEIGRLQEELSVAKRQMADIVLLARKEVVNFIDKQQLINYRPR